MYDINVNAPILMFHVEKKTVDFVLYCEHEITELPNY